MCWHQVSPSPFPSSSSHTTHLHYKINLYIHSTLTSLLSVYNYKIHISHVTWSAQEVRESKIDHTNTIFLHGTKPKAHNSSIGWQYNTHTHFKNAK